MPPKQQVAICLGQAAQGPHELLVQSEALVGVERGRTLGGDRLGAQSMQGFGPGRAAPVVVESLAPRGGGQPGSKPPRPSAPTGFEGLDDGVLGEILGVRLAPDERLSEASYPITLLEELDSQIGNGPARSRAAWRSWAETWRIPSTALGAARLA